MALCLLSSHHLSVNSCTCLLLPFAPSCLFSLTKGFCGSPPCRLRPLLHAHNFNEAHDDSLNQAAAAAAAAIADEASAGGALFATLLIKQWSGGDGGDAETRADAELTAIAAEASALQHLDHEVGADSVFTAISTKASALQHSAYVRTASAADDVLTAAAEEDVLTAAAAYVRSAAAEEDVLTATAAGDVLTAAAEEDVLTAVQRRALKGARTLAQRRSGSGKAQGGKASTNMILTVF